MYSNIFYAPILSQFFFLYNLICPECVLLLSKIISFSSLRFFAQYNIIISEFIYAKRRKDVHMKHKKDWYKDLVIYQIYPRSFKDGNNDGIGDLKGMIEKLEYLKELGINAVWMSRV